MKKRILSLTVALVMLLGMIPGMAAVESAAVDLTKTYTNILDAGFDPDEMMKDFPESVEMTYDAETQTLKMEDIGAAYASAYYGNYPMTLEDGYWTVQITPEEHEGHAYTYNGEDWSVSYNSDGSFSDAAFTRDEGEIYIYSHDLQVSYDTDTFNVCDSYDRETGDLLLQNVWPLDTNGDYCDVYYNPDGTIDRALAVIDEVFYDYTNGVWDVVPPKFSTEEELKAASPFVAPIDPSEGGVSDGEDGGSTSVGMPNLTVNDNTATSRRILNEVGYGYSASQYVLTADQLVTAQGKTITELQYWYAWTGEEMSRNLEIYLQPYTDESVTAFVNASSDKKVFAGTVTYSAGEEEVLSIPLDTPYDYENGNLLVTVIDKTGVRLDDTLEYYGDVEDNEVSVAQRRNNYSYSADNISLVSANLDIFRPKTGLILTGPKVTKELVLNDGETVSRNTPFSTAFKYSAAQYVLTADQLSDAAGGCITELQYWYRNTSGIGRTIEIYLEPFNGEKVDAFVDVSSDAKVFEGYVIFSSGDNKVLSLELDTPYDYESGNLLVTVVDKTGSYPYEGEVYTYGVNASEEVNTYDWNNSLAYDAYSLSNETVTTRNSNFLPKTGIVYKKDSAALRTANGAQIRVATERPQGLRFVSVIEKSAAYSNLREFGTVLIPTESLDDGDIENLVIGKTMANGHAVQKVRAVNFFGEDEETVTFTAVITNIAAKNYARSYTARAYAILEDGTVVYGGSYTSRSIYQVAKLILESDTATDAEIEAAQAIVNVVEKYGDNDAAWPWN